jgi:hypothetical protein
MKSRWVAGVVAGLLAVPAAQTADLVPPAKATSQRPGPAKSTAKAAPVRSSGRPAHRPPAALPPSARQTYALLWGVDQMRVQLTESGQLARFSYRVIDSAKAAPLQEKAAGPQMLDERAHALLQVPTMEKVGPLRQSNPAENGKSYWMTFSNKGTVVKVGDHVSVVVGTFRVDGLVVE